MAPTLSKLIDKLWTARSERLAAMKAIERMKSAEEDIRREIIDALHAASLTSASGKAGAVALKRSQVAQIVDEDALLKWGSRKANRDVIRIAVINEAWRLRAADGIEVPGVQGFTKEELKLSKV